MGYRADRIPAGTVMLWSGTIAAIPRGWALCDGQNGTPDLRDKFVIGAKVDSGGTAKTQVTGAYTQSGGGTAHTHTNGTTDTSWDYLYSSPGSGSIAQTSGGDFYDGTAGHEHTFSVSAASNLPPYFSLAYIMKL